ncbi:hypothetical protein PMAYCL1PPCAC_19649, partial [Pristionchus mayeri]
KENSAFNRFAKGDVYDMMELGYWIGLRCDEKKFYWVDGSPVDYTNFGDNTIKCNSTMANNRFYQAYDDGKWHYYVNWSSYSRGYVCQKNYRPEDSQCEEYELVPETTNCVAVYGDARTTTDAEKSCVATGGHLASIHDSTINDYIRRSTVALNLTNGVFIGLEQSGRNVSALTWKDKSKVDYTNIAPGFPNNSLGQCFAMQTSSTTGQWVNAICGSTKLPYACSMPALILPEKFETNECPTQNFTDGDTIYSPGFPIGNNTNSCEYIIIGPAGSKNVQVTVEFFESNKCCDSLTMYEGVVGEKQIAKLAGSTYTGKVYKSAQGPAMRLVYDVKSGQHVRGWQLKVKAI